MIARAARTRSYESRSGQRPVPDAALRRRGSAAGLRRFEPASLIWLLAAAALLFLVVGPIARLLISSLQATDTGAFTLRNYITAYGRIAQPGGARQLAALCPPK